MSGLDKSTIRPGLLVNLKTTLAGNVNYSKTQLEEEHKTDDGGALARWETEKSVADAAEHELSVQVRGKCRSLITGVCAKSNFGLLCAVSNQDKLAFAVAEARRLAEAFNSTSQLSKIGVYVLIGELVANEVEAAKALNFETRSLIDAMEEGIKKLDADQIRTAAIRAKNLGSMLSDEANEALSGAINAARKAARVIVKSGEIAVSEIDRNTMEVLASARTMFLDLQQTDDTILEPTIEHTAPIVDLDDDQPVITADQVESQLQKEAELEWE